MISSIFTNNQLKSFSLANNYESHCNRFNKRTTIVLRRIHSRRYGIKFQALLSKRLEQFCNGGRRARQVEPNASGLRRQDDRHPVMYRLKQRVRGRRDDRKRKNGFIGTRRLPFLPESSERKFGFVAKADPLGLPASSFSQFRPFIEAVCQNEASSLFQSLTEGRLFVKRLRARIDHFVPDGFVLRPMRDQPPGEKLDVIGLLVRNYRCELRWCNVVSRRQQTVSLFKFEGLANLLFRFGVGVTTAHYNFLILSWFVISEDLSKNTHCKISCQIFKIIDFAISIQLTENNKIDSSGLGYSSLISCNSEETRAMLESPNLAEDQNLQPRYSKEEVIQFKPDIETNYNCLLRPTLLSRIFGYNPNTFRNWEHDKNTDGKGPILHPVIADETKSRVRRLYTINDIQSIYDYVETQNHSRPKVSKTKTFAIWNNKGGVGKSVFAANIAASMSALMGLKVLLIDCDSQMDLTWTLGCLVNRHDSRSKKGASLRHILGYIDSDDKDGEKEIQVPFEKAKLSLSPTLDLIPADEDLNELDFDFSYLNDLFYADVNGAKIDVSRVANIKERFLNEYILNGKTNYDVVIFDCGPNKGLFNVNILYAVDNLITPIGVQAKSEHSMENVQKWLLKLSRLNSGFTFEDIKAVLNFIDIRENVKLDGIQRLEEKYQRNILSKIYFPKATAVDQSEKEKEPVFQRASDTKKERCVPQAKKIANAFWELSHEILGLKPESNIFPEVMY